MSSSPQIVAGLDLGDKHSYLFVVDANGEILEESRVPTTAAAFQRVFHQKEPMLVALEAGTHSPWASRAIDACGHSVLVANPRNVRLISQNTQKNDRLDAQTLARLARFDPGLLSPLKHRSKETQRALS